MVQWRPAGFNRTVWPTRDQLGNSIERHRIPSQEAIITVTTRPGWHQRTLDELFSPELDDRLTKIGMAERIRRGIRAHIIVTATAQYSDSVQHLVWEPGQLYPALDEHQHVRPAFWKPTAYDLHGDPTAFEGDDLHPLSSGQLLDPLAAHERRRALGLSH